MYKILYHVGQLNYYLNLLFAMMIKLKFIKCRFIIIIRAQIVDRFRIDCMFLCMILPRIGYLALIISAAIEISFRHLFQVKNLFRYHSSEARFAHLAILLWKTSFMIISLEESLFILVVSLFLLVVSLFLLEESLLLLAVFLYLQNFIIFSCLLTQLVILISQNSYH